MIDTLFDCQSQSCLIERNLSPGDTVRVSLPGVSVICRAWQHSVPQVRYSEISDEVTETEDSVDIQPGTFPQKIEKLSVAETNSVEVVVIGLSHLKKKNLPNLLRKLLRNYRLTNGCQVKLHEKEQKRTGVFSMKVFSSQPVFRLSADAKVAVRDVTSKRREELLHNGRVAALPLGGAAGLIEQMSRAMSEKRSVLVSGLSGSGKTALVTWVADRLGEACLTCHCSSLARPQPGEAEAALRSVWEEAREAEAVLVLDSVELLTARAGRGDRLTSQLVALMDSRQLTVVGLTSQSQAVDTSCRRPGRFETEISIKTPDLDQRREMLAVLCERQGVVLCEEVTSLVEKSTAGWLVSDLALLLTRLSRLSSVDLQAVETQLELARPAQLRTGLGSVSAEKVSWDSLGGLHQVKSKLVRAIQLPLTDPDSFSRLGIRPSAGVLLSGPPGCGKTRLVRAVASTCHLTFLSLTPAMVFSPYVGDSERAVVEVFTKARQAAPALLFIDEIDGLVTGRDTSGAQSASDRVLATLLTEMDGVTDLGGLVLVAATNCPERLDSALTRPGRLDTHIMVPPPCKEDRREILQTLLRNIPHRDIDLHSVAERTDNFTGADLECVVREAVLETLASNIEADCLDQQHLDRMVSRYTPSLSRASS